MKHLFYTFLLFALFLPSAKTLAQTQYVFRISFTDKKGTSGVIGSPSAYLSARAIARRSKQSILIDGTDLPVSKFYIDTTLDLANGILHTCSRWQNNCVILVNDTSTINLLRSKAFVKSAQYVAIFSSPLHLLKEKSGVGKDIATTDKSLAKTTGGIAYYGDAYDQIKLANGDYLHDRGLRGKGKMIAVIDEGFGLVNTLPGFDSLRSSGRIKDTYNFNTRATDVYSSSSQHGTQVLSTMAGILTGSYVGTAPDADYALYTSENSAGEQPFEMDNLVSAMERADSIGADVITISLGYNTFNIGTLNADLSPSDIDGNSTIAAMGANTAAAKGMLVIASAGNEGSTVWEKILTPGDADSVLTCGSVTIDKNRAGSSGKGPNAAGVIKPDVCMLGAPAMVFNSSGTVSSSSGTSFATPELAGLAACLWQGFPSATPYSLRKAIRESAHIATAPNNETGYGVPDFGKATLSMGVPFCICAEDNITVSPNPFINKISVSANGVGNQGKLSWSLYNMMGQRLLNGEEIITNTNSFFDIAVPSNFPGGTYLLHIENGKYKDTIKIQK